MFRPKLKTSVCGIKETWSYINVLHQGYTDTLKPLTTLNKVWPFLREMLDKFHLI